MKRVQAYLAEVEMRVEERLDELLNPPNVPYSQLFEAARYSALGGGKRLRPALALATAEMLGCDYETALTPASALELVHTYSRIHDGLPSIDNAHEARGKASLHTVIPEGQAVLVGDYLLTYSFEVLATAPGLTAEQQLSLISILSSRAGGFGMIGGQVLELISEGETLELDTLESLYAMKTGALLTASLEFGGVLGGANEETMMNLQTVGEAVGLAFLIVEDILRAPSDGEEAVPDGASYVSLMGLDQAVETAANLQETARLAIEAIPGDTALLMELADLITRRT